MGDHDHGTFSTAQLILQPVGHGIVQMVGRLVQQQDLRRGQQHRYQCQTLALSAGQLPAGLVKFRNAQFRQHAFGICLNGSGVFLHAVAPQYCLQYRLLRRELRVLGQIAHQAVICLDHSAVIGLLQSRNDF